MQLFNAHCHCAFASTLFIVHGPFDIHIAGNPYCWGFGGGPPPPGAPPPGPPRPPPGPPRPLPRGGGLLSAPGGAAAPGVPSFANPPALSGYLARSCSPSMQAVSVCSYPVGRPRNPKGTLRLRLNVSVTVIGRVNATGSSTRAS